MIISVFDTFENIVGKGEMACTSKCLLFPQCFEKASFLDASKGVIVWESVKPLPDNAAFRCSKDLQLWKNGEKRRNRL